LICTQANVALIIVPAVDQVLQDVFIAQWFSGATVVTHQGYQLRRFQVAKGMNLEVGVVIAIQNEALPLFGKNWFFSTTRATLDTIDMLHAYLALILVKHTHRSRSR